ncbi:hypothetical protein B0H13DRAFT_1877320 [Mycena leptocephala]|nr:hypothetical protein B0H13DRAFT_1877320 [Mycena leptocephala]
MAWSFSPRPLILLASGRTGIASHFPSLVASFNFSRRLPYSWRTMRISEVLFLTVLSAVWLVQAQETGGGGKLNKAKAFNVRVCPAVDQDGTPLQTSDSISPLICRYPAAGTCRYFATPRSPLEFLSTPPEFISPQYKDPELKYRQYKYKSDVFCKYHRACFFTNSSNLTGERGREQCDFFAFCICHSDHSKQMPPRVIAAICVAVASVVVGLIIALIVCTKRRRRAAKHHATAIDREANTVSPFALITQMDGHNDETAPSGDSNVRRTSASTIPRQDLETELRMVHEKMADLQDLERSSTRETADSGTRRVLRLMSIRSSSTRASPDVRAELEAAKEQINMLLTRMHVLEANANSAYGAEFSNESPPAAPEEKKDHPVHEHLDAEAVIQRIRQHRVRAKQGRIFTVWMSFTNIKLQDDQSNRKASPSQERKEERKHLKKDARL